MDLKQPDWLLQMEGILEMLNEGVLISDESHRILFVNSKLAQMSDSSASEIVGHHASEIYSAEEYAFLQAQFEMRSRTGYYRFEFLVPRKDGSRLPAIVSSRNFKDPEGHIFAVVTFTDISDQKRAEAELRDANSKLEQRQKEIDDDLALAARVQQSLAPHPLVWNGVLVDTHFRPVHTIGGDFGLAAPHGEQHLDLFVGDVTGHGTGSALVANRVYTEVLTELRGGLSLPEVLHRLNRFMMANIAGSALYFTIAAARIDRSGHLHFAGAGHPPAMVVTPGEEPRLLESRCPVLGALPNFETGDAAIDTELRRGDRVVLYTDGITDVFDSRGEMLGIAGVQKFVREASRQPFSEMKGAILKRVAAWCDGSPTDDATIVLAEVT